MGDGLCDVSFNLWSGRELRAVIATSAQGPSGLGWRGWAEQAGIIFGICAFYNSEYQHRTVCKHLNILSLLAICNQFQPKVTQVSYTGWVGVTLSVELKGVNLIRLDVSKTRQNLLYDFENWCRNSWDIWCLQFLKKINLLFL